MTLAERELLEVLAEAVASLAPAHRRRIARLVDALRTEPTLEQMLSEDDSNRIMSRG